MSASNKKKLRKEQNAAALTEKQRQEQKEAKKLKVYTLSFAVVMVLVIAIILGVTLKPSVSGMIDRNTHAVTVGNHELNTTELSYYYVDAINTFTNQFSSYGDYASLYMQMMGLDPSKPLDEQIYDKETNQTWAQYFIEQGKDSAKLNYALYDAAIADGFKLSEDDQKAIDNLEGNLEFYAAYAGYSSVSSYLRNIYGDGAKVDSYKEYYRVSLIASGYASEHRDELSESYKDTDFRAFEKDKLQEYNAYNYALHKLNVSDYLKFLGLGTVTKDDAGKETTTYTEAEKKQAAEAALKDAQILAAADIDTLEKLNAAINKLEINLPKKDNNKDDDDKKDNKALIEVKPTENVLYDGLLSKTNEDIQKWISDSTRKEGNVKYFELSTGEDDKKEITGYYVVMFLKSNDNAYHTADVQHILVKFTGGKKNETTDKTEYTQEEKDKAKAAAQAILDDFLKGEKKDSDAFGALAKTKSEDTGSKSNGGLIEAINLGSGYVEPFTEWALAEHKEGDTGLIETEYGWHVMFFKASSELNYRDTMIKADLLTQDYEAWEKALTDPIKVTDVDLSGLETDMILGG